MLSNLKDCNSMNRRSKAGVQDRVFPRLQEKQILAIHIEYVCLDTTMIKVHADGTRALKRAAPRAIGRSRGRNEQYC